MSLQLRPWFTTSLSQSKTTLSPKGVVLPTPCPGHMLLLAPLCQHHSSRSYQQAGSVWWVIFQPDEEVDLPHHVVSQLLAWHSGGGRNAELGWGGMGKQDCPFWQLARAGLTRTTRGNSLLIFPLVNTNNSLYWGSCEAPLCFGGTLTTASFCRS